MAARDDKSQFVAMLVEHQPRIYAYIRTLIPERNAAEDVFQDTCVVLWEKFDTFDPSRSFLKWAFGVARFEVLAHHRDKSRSRLRFTPEELEQLAVDAATDCEDVSDLRAALDHCLDQLPVHSRKLLAQRYEPGANVQAIADDLGRPVATIYGHLRQLRARLYKCIAQTMQSWERSV